MGKGCDGSRAEDGGFVGQAWASLGLGSSLARVGGKQQCPSCPILRRHHEEALSTLGPVQNGEWGLVYLGTDRARRNRKGQRGKSQGQG